MPSIWVEFVAGPDLWSLPTVARVTGRRYRLSGGCNACLPHQAVPIVCRLDTGNNILLGTLSGTRVAAGDRAGVAAGHMGGACPQCSVSDARCLQRAWLHADAWPAFHFEEFPQPHVDEHWTVMSDDSTPGFVFEDTEVLLLRGALSPRMRTCLDGLVETSAPVSDAAIVQAVCDVLAKNLDTSSLDIRLFIEAGRFQSASLRLIVSDSDRGYCGTACIVIPGTACSEQPFSPSSSVARRSQATTVAAVTGALTGSIPCGPGCSLRLQSWRMHPQPHALRLRAEFPSFLPLEVGPTLPRIRNGGSSPPATCSQACCKTSGMPRFSLDYQSTCRALQRMVRVCGDPCAQLPQQVRTTRKLLRIPRAAGHQASIL